ncbi:hypothetical protein R5R35_013113 [Gryllus longicercus]|uniref:DM domain-containing protein n=1 Tax=Gryllus longicercus TaxID=2509291 RepID=A0AAN9W1V1_9ORTH
MSDSGEPSDAHLMSAPSTSGDEAPGEGRQRSNGAADANAVAYGGQPPSKRTPYCAKCRNHGLTVKLKGHKHKCRFRFHNCPRCWVTTMRQHLTAIQTADRRREALHEESERKRAAGLMTPDELAAEKEPTPPCTSNMVVPVPAACKLMATPGPLPGHPHTPLLPPPPSHQLDPLQPLPTLPLPPPPPPPPGHHLAPLPPQQWPPSTTLDAETPRITPSLRSGRSSVTRILRGHEANGVPAHHSGESVEVLPQSIQMLLDAFRLPMDALPLVYMVLKDSRSDVKEASKRILEGQKRRLSGRARQ